MFLPVLGFIAWAILGAGAFFTMVAWPAVLWIAHLEQRRDFALRRLDEQREDRGLLEEIRRLRSQDDVSHAD